MNTYLWLDAAILIGPLALSFDKKVAFFRNWPALFASMAVVSTVYVIWDVLATKAGHWSFSASHAGDLAVLGLPLGELLFFVVVPYACIFIYEVLRAYVPARPLLSHRVVTPGGLALAVAFLAVGIVFRDQAYTLLAMIGMAVLCLLAGTFGRRMLSENHSWLYLAVSLLPFLIANGILTGLPIVSYSPAAIWGVRVTTIPLEDFFYNTAMLGLYLLVYYHLRRDGDDRG